MKAVVFTEGGKGIGFGHVIRCLAIRRAFERAGIKTELIVEGDASVAGVLGRERYTAKRWRTGRAAGLAAGADIALVDSYLADGAIYREIAAAVKHCLYLDDCARLDYPEGTIVNYNAYGPAMRYSGSDGAHCLLGTAYAPLRKEFLADQDREIRKDIGKALLMFGGADKTGRVLDVLKFLTDNYPDMKKTVIAGAGSNCAGAIKRLKDKNTGLVLNAGAARVRRAMLDCDIAFTAGGVTLYELARTGTPGVVFRTAKNQEKNAAAMAKAGAVYPAGLSAGKVRVPELKTIMARLRPAGVRKRMSGTGKKLVDGLGAARVARYARSMVLESEIIMRRAVPEDVLPVFILSSDPGVRECSINSGKITLARHKKWFSEQIGSPYEFFLIAEYNGKFAGQVRFAVRRPTATITISVVPAMRGNGAGSVILCKAVEFLEARYPEIGGVLAYIKPYNTASQKLFLASGFKKIGAPRLKGTRLYLYRYTCGEK